MVLTSWNDLEKVLSLEASLDLKLGMGWKKVKVILTLRNGRRILSMIPTLTTWWKKKRSRRMCGELFCLGWKWELSLVGVLPPPGMSSLSSSASAVSLGSCA